jgi:hypothetical protein
LELIMPFTFIETADGQMLKVRVDDDGILVHTDNGDDFSAMPAGVATNADHADVADTADAPTDATAFTATLNAATSSLKGLESAADKAAADIANARWEVTQAAFLKSKVPQLTSDFQYMKCGQYPLGSINTAVASTNATTTVGGAIGAGAGSYSVIGCPVFQDGKTFFGFVARGKLAVTTTGHTATIGLTNSASNHDIGVKSNFDTDATHYLLAAAGTETVGTIVNNGGIHDFAVTGDGTNIKLWVDTVQAASIAQSGETTQAYFPLNSRNTIAADAQTLKFGYSYVEP